MQVRELRCPRCFAPVDASRGQVSTCRYCGTTVALDGSAAAAAPPPGVGTGGVFLDDAGANKIAVIKVVREHTGLGLREAKDIVDRAPVLIAQWNDPARAAAFQRDLAASGARARTL